MSRSSIDFPVAFLQKTEVQLSAPLVEDKAHLQFIEPKSHEYLFVCQ